MKISTKIEYLDLGTNENWKVTTFIGFYQLNKGKNSEACGFDITANSFPVAKYLRYSFMEYMKSKTFNPDLSVD